MMHFLLNISFADNILFQVFCWIISTTPIHHKIEANSLKRSASREIVGTGRCFCGSRRSIFWQIISYDGSIQASFLPHPCYNRCW
jgi:hypothetical protein